MIIIFPYISFFLLQTEKKHEIVIQSQPQPPKLTDMLGRDFKGCCVGVALASSKGCYVFIHLSQERVCTEAFYTIDSLPVWSIDWL